jgi:hypothetical protein
MKERVMTRHSGLTLAVLVAVLSSALWAAGPAVADNRHQAGAPPRHSPPAPAVQPGRWWDGAHGHQHYYPVTGWRVGAPPAQAHPIYWGGVRYHYYGGVWYYPWGGAYYVTRPPYGVVVTDLPTFATVVTIGGIGYWYANGVYYRRYADGGYEVAPSPILATGEGSAGRLYVYPRKGQTAEKQASDEYECHRWAVEQTGFDPSSAATNGQGSGAERRGDYGRAQRACLEGRDYTVR